MIAEDRLRDDAAPLSPPELAPGPALRNGQAEMQTAVVITSGTTESSMISDALATRGIRRLDAFAALPKALPDVVIVDHEWLIASADEVARLRPNSTTPLLVLVTDEDRALRALAHGATAVLSKPSSPEVIGAAASALLSHNERWQSLAQTSELIVGDLTVSLVQHSVERDGRRCHLSPTEWRLFSCFLSNPGRTITRAELANGTWGSEHPGRSALIELYISRLRRKIERDPREPEIIATVRGRGYQLHSIADNSLL